MLFSRVHSQSSADCFPRIPLPTGKATRLSSEKTSKSKKTWLSINQYVKRPKAVSIPMLSSGKWRSVFNDPVSFTSAGFHFKNGEVVGGGWVAVI